MSSEASGSSRARSSSASSSSPIPFDAPPELVDEYEQLLRQRFDGLLPAHPRPPLEHDVDDDHDDDDAGRPMTKAEKQNAKKKRRKERERLAKQQLAQAGPVAEVEAAQTAFEFRLFSSCPVRPISIVPPAEDYLLPPNPRHIGLSREEQTRLRERAEAAAIDFDPARPSSPSTPTCSYASRWTRTDRPVKVMRATTRPGPYDDLPNIFIGTPADRRRGIGKPRAIELELQPAPPATRTAKPTRRGRRKGNKQRPAPAYWTPAAGRHVGGKSMSTVWGYGLGMAVR